MAHMAPQQGMNWRDYMGAIICLIGYKVSVPRIAITCSDTHGDNKGTFQARKNQEAVEDLKKQLSVAENLLSKREINCVDDLNIGDLSAFMEISVPMECLAGFHWADYPYLNKLYQVDQL